MEICFHFLFVFQQVEESVLSSGVNKKLVLILNKIGELKLVWYANYHHHCHFHHRHCHEHYYYYNFFSWTWISLIQNYEFQTWLHPHSYFIADLVPREIVDQWLKYLRNEFPTVAFKASTPSQKHNLVSKLHMCSNSTLWLAPGDLHVLLPSSKGNSWFFCKTRMQCTPGLKESEVWGPWNIS